MSHSSSHSGSQPATAEKKPPAHEQTNAEKKAAAIAKAQQAIKDAVHANPEGKDAAAALLKAAQEMPD